jgi:hypothetical protein
MDRTWKCGDWKSETQKAISGSEVGILFLNFFSDISSGTVVDTSEAHFPVVSVSESFLNFVGMPKEDIIGYGKDKGGDKAGGVGEWVEEGKRKGGR